MTSSVINHQLREAPSPRGKVTVQCEVTPGEIRTVEVPGEMLERYVAVKLVPVPGKPGTLRPSVRQYAPLMPVTDDLGDRMGWGLERRQILALGLAGMIDCFRATTAATLVDPVSVWEHIYNCRLSEAAKVWTPEHIRDYSDARDFIKGSGIITSDRRRKADAMPHLEFDFGEEPQSQPEGGEDE